MNANELADAMEGRARVRRKITNREDTGDRLSDQLDQAAAMLRQQALEIQALHQILGYEGVAVGQDYLDECVAELRKAQEK
jgi:replicative DNA helicase